MRMPSTIAAAFVALSVSLVLAEKERALVTKSHKVRADFQEVLPERKFHHHPGKKPGTKPRLPGIRGSSQ